MRIWLNIIQTALFFFIKSPVAFAQPDFRWPIDPPYAITGNYGELRPNHFHAGLDFSTNNKINVPIYAAEHGYVSRIRMSSSGYGKCLYITHPNGLVTVYAHLNGFSNEINQFLRLELLKQKVNEIDHYTAKNQFVVKKGQVIGFSGNSGGSSGPHLHFELRDEITEVPLNPLRIMKLSDQTKPQVHHLAFFDLSDTLTPNVLKHIQTPVTSNASVPKITLEAGIVGIGFDASDRVSSTGNNNNVYAVDIYIDDQLFYAHHLDHIDFADGRYVNEYVFQQNKIKFQKCFLPTVYPQRFDVSANNKGRIVFNDTLFHEVRMKLSDEAGNFTEVRIRLRTLGLKDFKMVKRKGTLLDCTKSETLVQNELCLTVPAKTFYASAAIELASSWARNAFVQVLPASINMSGPADLAFKIPESFLKFRSKLVLKNGTNVFVGTTTNDSVHFKIKVTGKFDLLIDSVPPSVKLLHAKARQAQAFLAFKVSEQLSGVQSYNMYVNDEWQPCEYDAKSETLYYFFEGTKPKGVCKLRIEVTDRSGNRIVTELLTNS